MHSKPLNRKEKKRRRRITRFLRKLNAKMQFAPIRYSAKKINAVPMDLPSMPLMNKWKEKVQESFYEAFKLDIQDYAKARTVGSLELKA